MRKYLILLSLGICALLASCASAPSAEKGHDGPRAEEETSDAAEHEISGNVAASVENLPEPEEVEIFDEGETEISEQPQTHEDEADTLEELEPLSDDEAVFISPADDSDTPETEDDLTDDGITLDSDNVPLITDGSTLISAEDDEESAQDEIPGPQETALPGIAERTATNRGDTQGSSAQSSRDPQPSPAASGTERTTRTETTAYDTDAEDGLSEPQEPDGQTEQEAEETEVITPSRSVTLKSNQYLDVVYPGSGWVYLGETDGGDRIRYFGRKVGTSDTSFSLRTKEEGSTILHFYKNDALTGNYIDDYLAVEIKGKSSDNSRVTAPSYAEAVPPKSPLSGGTAQEAGSSGTGNASGGTRNTGASSAEAKKSVSGDEAAERQEQESSKNSSPKENAMQSRYDESTGSTAIQNSETATSAQSPRTDEGNSMTSPPEPAQPGVSVDTENLSADEILDLAQKSYDSAQYAETLAYLNAFFEKAVNRVDEGLFLQGQTLETNSSVRNIKAALDIYETIVRRYPQSINWAKANERITYLRRFYFNIR